MVDNFVPMHRPVRKTINNNEGTDTVYLFDTIFQYTLIKIMDKGITHESDP